MTHSLRAVADLVDALSDEELPEALVRLAGGLEAFLVAARSVFRRPFGERRAPGCWPAASPGGGSCAARAVWGRSRRKSW